MALTEQTGVIFTVLEDGQIQVRRVRRVFDGAEWLAEQYHRHVLAPGDDVAQEEVRVQAIARLLWTPAVGQAYQDSRAQNRTR